MESDISLIEVAGEDDSLLQRIPEDDVDSITAGTSDYFLCSPLVSARSNSSNAISSTAPTDCTDKENTNADNLEGPKLSIVPQSMKRKKKAGGYNLRKSIAWNKAFFTEEGVLNPLELSIITGSTSCGEALATIDEGAPAMRDCCNDLPSEDKLSKDASTSAPVNDRKNGRGLIPKRASTTKAIPASTVKLKEPLAKDVNRSGSKRGNCTRPVAPLSTKRHTALNTTRTAKREEKVSRIPVPKRDPTVLSRTQKSSTIPASNTRGNQVTQRVGSKTMPKGASVNTKSAPKGGSESKSLKAKTSIQQSRKEMPSAGLKMDSSRLHHESASNSDKGLQVATNSSSSKFPPSSDHDGSKKVSGSFPYDCPLDGGSMLNQTQMAKPSGLRMPSPSMGFFAQKKVDSFQSPPRSASQPYDLSKSNNPSLRKADLLNPTRELAHGNTAKAGNSEASGKTNTVSCLSSVSSIGPTSHDRVEPVSEAINRLQGEVNAVDASTNKDLSARGLENNLGGTLKLYIGDVNDLGLQSMPSVLNRLKRANDGNEQSLEQVECMNSSNCTLEQIPSNHQKSGATTCNSLKRSRTSEEFEHGRLQENVGSGSHAEEGSASHEDMFEGEDAALETHQMRISSTRDAEASDIGRCISNYDKTKQNTSESNDLNSMHIDDEKSEIPMSNISSLQGKGLSQTTQNAYASNINEAFAGKSNSEFLSSGEFDELQTHCTGVVEVHQQSNQEKCSNGDLLQASHVSEEYREEINADGVVVIRHPKDYGNQREETHDIKMDDRSSETLLIEEPNRSPKCSTAESFKHDRVSVEAASVTMSKETTSKEGTTCNDATSFCSITEELDSSVSNKHMSRVSVEQFLEAEELDNQETLQKDENSVRQNEDALNGGIQHPETEVCSSDNSDAKVQLENPGDDQKQNAPEIKSSTNAVPFSDEWLAAIEAAGEEILTMKGGAVQNSPPDKPQPEPSPWSPVKRNNQGVGPFDCTKCTLARQPHES